MAIGNRMGDAVKAYLKEFSLRGKVTHTDTAILRWAAKNQDDSPHPQPSDAALEQAMMDKDDVELREETARTGSMSKIINNASTIKDLAASIQNCKDLWTNNPDAGALTTFVTANTLVLLITQLKKNGLIESIDDLV